MRSSKTLFFVFSLTLFSYVNFSIAGTNILPPPKKLSEHVYAWIGPLDGPTKENQGYRMNLAFVVGTKSVAVLDTGYTEAMANEMLIHIRKITDKPVKYAINSNGRPDRFMGNPVFRQAGTTIFASKKEAAGMEANGINFAGAIERILELPEGSIKIPGSPDRIVDQETQLDLGGVTINLKSFGASHTADSLVVEIPEDKIVFAGDILYAQRLLAVRSEGNVKSWIAVFDQLKEYGDVIFIPGHGQPGPLKDFDFPTRQYLHMLLTHMDKMVDEGVDVQDAINKLDQSRFSKLANYDQLSGLNASRTYLEREQAAFE